MELLRGQYVFKVGLPGSDSVCIQAEDLGGPTTTMVVELGMLAMHLRVVFISMVVVININITNVILLLLLLYKDDDDDDDDHGGDVQLPLNPIKHQCNVPFTLY